MKVIIRKFINLKKLDIMENNLIFTPKTVILIVVLILVFAELIRFARLYIAIMRSHPNVASYGKTLVPILFFSFFLVLIFLLLFSSAISSLSTVTITMVLMLAVAIPLLLRKLLHLAITGSERGFSFWRYFFMSNRKIMDYYRRNRYQFLPLRPAMESEPPKNSKTALQNVMEYSKNYSSEQAVSLLEQNPGVSLKDHYFLLSHPDFSEAAFHFIKDVLKHLGKEITIKDMAWICCHIKKRGNRRTFTSITWLSRSLWPSMTST